MIVCYLFSVYVLPSGVINDDDDDDDSRARWMFSAASVCLSTR